MERNSIFKCDICGNIVELLHVGGGELVCCGQPMRLVEEKTSEEGKEKHLPVVEKSERGFRVKVGELEHPMEENHYIEWIELIVDGKVYRSFLNPGDKPEVEFEVEGENLKVREYCTVHGLWSSNAVSE